MTRFAIDARLHAYAPGGISRYAIHLARGLVRICQTDGVTLIRSRRDANRYANEAFDTLTAWTPAHHKLERYALGAELAPHSFDIVHSTDFIPPAWGAKRRVITVHDLNFLHYPQYLTEAARSYYNGQILWATRVADAIVADSYATKNDLVAMLKVPEAKVTVTHLAADACFHALEPEQYVPVLDKYQLLPGYWLFVGTWEPRKNLPALLDALALLRDAEEQRSLVIAGRPGWLYDDIFSHIQRLDLMSQVHLIKEPTLDEVIALYNGALALILPAFYEGFGLPPLEAMQIGIPVIVSNRASLPEVVGDAGLLIDPDDPATLADACLRVARDGNLRKRMKLAGLVQAKKFTWEETARQTLQVYRNLLG